MDFEWERRIGSPAARAGLAAFASLIWVGQYTSRPSTRTQTLGPVQLAPARARHLFTGPNWNRRGDPPIKSFARAWAWVSASCWAAFPHTAADPEVSAAGGFCSA